MKKRALFSLIFVGIFSAFLILCWVVILFDANWFWDNPAHLFVSALGQLGLIGYNPDIGGHSAHLHCFIWLCGVAIFFFSIRSRNGVSSQNEAATKGALYNLGDSCYFRDIPCRFLLSRLSRAFSPFGHKNTPKRVDCFGVWGVALLDCISITYGLINKIPSGLGKVKGIFAPI